MLDIGDGGKIQALNLMPEVHQRVAQRSNMPLKQRVSPRDRLDNDDYHEAVAIDCNEARSFRASKNRQLLFPRSDTVSSGRKQR